MRKWPHVHRIASYCSPSLYFFPQSRLFLFGFLDLFLHKVPRFSLGLQTQLEVKALFSELLLCAVSLSAWC